MYIPELTRKLQRDFKAVKELEMIPGFTWDRTQHKLCASQEAWEAAEKVSLARVYWPSIED